MEYISFRTPDLISQFLSEEYQLHEKIGQGGFAQVYKASKKSTNQLVAIKFLTLNPEWDDAKKDRCIERFKREAFLSSRLQHPNIVRLLDKGCYGDELLYAVFEFVDGQSLKEALSESGVLLPTEAAELMGQVLDALVHAHAKGVIHRDIKPSNIMLSKAGAKIHVKILDFGIGTLLEDARQHDFKNLTITNETLGTPSYCAPEQLRGEQPTPKTDLYVWGLVFIECLTGSPAIHGSSLASICHQQLSPGNVPIPPSITGHPVAHLLRRVLNKKVPERASCALEVYNELTKINFATLVGDIFPASVGRLLNSSPACAAQVDQDTLDQFAGARSNFAEKRLITTLCVSINVSFNADPFNAETFDEILKQQAALCIDTAIHYGAFHAGTLGDTLLFYFGYPFSSDSDCRLCARTALEIAGKIFEANTLSRQAPNTQQCVDIQCRMGMHTGPVTIFENLPPEGGTPNLAMALARHAAPGQVLCSQETKLLLERYIAFEPYPSAKIPPAMLTKSLHILTGECNVEFFGFLWADIHETDFVGREQELGVLNQWVNESCHYVHLHGEAGIGKSRLVYEFRETEVQVFQCLFQCLPEHRNNALYPVLHWIKQYYSLESLDQEASTQRLRKNLSQIQPLNEPEVMSVLRLWLELPNSENADSIELTPERQKHILFSALAALLNPVDALLPTSNKLIIVEDLHWADPMTLAFLSFYLSGSANSNSSLMFVSTSRQPLPERLLNSGIKSVELKHLDTFSSGQLVSSLFGYVPVATEVLDFIVNRAGGVPLFIEEMIGMLKHKALVEKMNGCITFSSAERHNEVPISLLGLLQNKLDLLNTARETAQLAALIGREFNFSLLAQASLYDHSKLLGDIRELIAAEIIYVNRKIDGDAYIFRHALIREAVAGSVPSVHRKDFSSRIATALMLAPLDIAGKSVLLNHLLAAERYAEAFKLGTELIEDRLRQGDYSSAFNDVNQCKGFIDQLDSHSNRLLAKLELNSFSISILVATEGSGSDALLAIANENTSLCSINPSLDSSGIDYDVDRNLIEYLHHASWAAMTHFHMSSLRQQALKSAQAELAFCLEYNTDPDALLVVNTQIANCYLLDGDIQRSSHYLESAFGIFSYQPFEDFQDNSFIKYGFSAKVFPYMIGSIVELLKGNTSTGKSYSLNSLEMASLIASPITEAISIGYGTIFAYLANDRLYMVQLLERMERLIEKNADIIHFATYTNIASAWFNKDIQSLRAHIATLKSTKQTQWLSLYLCMLLELEDEMGDDEQWQSTFTELCQWIETTGERVCQDKLNSLSNRWAA